MILCRDFNDNPWPITEEQWERSNKKKDAVITAARALAENEALSGYAMTRLRVALEELDDTRLSD
jgi:hypothetical protein